ncbi:DUF4179 domain-containing protein [Cytobacillus purgationiresistens]|uniref:DUF4179 domain-containing protein n=1 Tax=Cytobacillus purgationiresistens TaxID=863449 RepID=A0ABU0AP90_9BACI|nr:DUF4179 domain-containing protein [Cytobacillus purgationiresistens]MDQ0273008.1 hypothetical protein [Cytobacillus purgationiresistens]
MFEKEEKDLTKLNEHYTNRHHPVEKIDAAIFAGFNKGKDEKNRRSLKKWLTSGMAVAVLVLLFVTGIKVSPAFAQYVAVIPGMEKIVDMIRHDKGLLAAVENEYVQEINVSEEKGGMKVTIDSVIADEYGMILFYTIESDNGFEENHPFINLESIQLKSASGPNPVISSSGFDNNLDQDKKKYTSSIELFFQEPLQSNDFIIEMNVKANKRQNLFEIPFSLKQSYKPNKIYEINETVSVEGQKITFEEMKIYPLRAAVRVKFDLQNSKKIFEFNDLRLVDEHGESWTKITNGVTASHISDNEWVVYLQSNYFKEPKELYLTFSKLQALDKDELQVIVDTDKEEIVKQPKGSILSFAQLEGSEIAIRMKTKEFSYFPFGTVIDADGEEIHIAHGISSTDEEGIGLIGLGIDKAQYKNPLTIELNYYPSWIEEEIKIKLQ